MKTVCVYVIRHGNYDAKTGSLTDEGRRRVVAAARAHLSGKRLGSVIYSGMRRTLETVNAALEAIEHPMPAGNPVEMPTFGYEWAAADDPTYYVRVKDAITQGRPNTAAVWREHWASAPKVSEAVRKALLDIARVRAESTDGADDVLIGGHEFVAVSATLDPDTSCLGEADIIRYDIVVEGSRAEIVKWKTLPVPAVS